MWLTLLASLLKLFNIIADGAAKSGAMDAAQALLVSDVIQASLKRIEVAHAIRRDVSLAQHDVDGVRKRDTRFDRPPGPSS